MPFVLFAAISLNAEASMVVPVLLTLSTTIRKQRTHDLERR